MPQSIGRSPSPMPHTASSTATAALAGLAILLLTGTANAQPANTCAAGKMKCTSVFANAAFKCYAKAFKKGFTSETNAKGDECVRKARQKFGTALSTKPGCIDKIEAKQKQDKPETICPPGDDE